MAGLALAVFVGLNQEDGRESAPILAASGLVYLGAAALRKPAAAWPLFVGTFAVITATRINVMPVDATWMLLGTALLLAGYGRAVVRSMAEFCCVLDTALAVGIVIAVVRGVSETPASSSPRHPEPVGRRDPPREILVNPVKSGRFKPLP